ncbi:MAG: hypothetical protein FWF72_02725 [Paludibacter sp.]|nr:hypothetical protein [Paludibacter sp.]
MRKKHFLGKFILVIVVIAAVSAVVMLLWNWIVPQVIGWNAINYWQALGLSVLCRILFGKFGGFHRHNFHGNRAHYDRLHDKWEKMSPEQREQFCKRGRRFFDFEKKDSNFEEKKQD